MILGEVTHTVTRHAAGTYVNGRHVEGSASTFTVEISIQPINGYDRQMLLEGERDSVTHKGYTTTQLLTDDEVTDGGEQYVVVKAHQQRDIIPHRKVWLTREREAEA